MQHTKKVSKLWIPVVVAMLIAQMAIPAYAAMTVEPVTGLTVTDSTGNGSLSNGTVTITANGDKGMLDQRVTNTITIANNSGNTATVSFDYVASNYDTFTLDGASTDASGSCIRLLDSGGTITFTLRGKHTGWFGSDPGNAVLTLNNFNLTVAKPSSDITFTYNSNLGSITVAGEKADPGTTVQVSLEDGVAVTATPVSGAEFSGWINAETGEILPTNGSGVLKPTEDMTIMAAFSNVSSAPWFMVNGTHLFNDLATAITRATSAVNKTIVLVGSGTISGGPYTIPDGITFLVPFDDANTLRGALVEDTINSSVPAGIVSYDSYGSTVTSEYRRLTMSSGSSIAVNGTLEVGSMTHPMAKGQLGPYGLIQMEKGSSITVNAGAELFAWGYIRGSGTVTVNPNAVVYENFDATDYPGSAGNMNTLNQAKVFAMKEYSLNNVEVEMTVNAGATVKGAICIYGQQIQYNTFVKTFVGSGDSDMIQLTSGTLKKSYVSSRQKFVLDGKANVNPFNIKISFWGIPYEVNSSQTSGLPFPSNWDFTVSSGSMVPNDSILLLAGATVTINEGASIVIPSGKNVYVFDAAEDPKGAERNDAKVDVNGTVAVNGAFYTTKSGANITSSQGTGQVVCNTIGAATSVKLKNSNTTAGDYEITSAKLRNANGTYTETAGAIAPITYYYCADCGFWVTNKAITAHIIEGGAVETHAHSMSDAVRLYGTPSTTRYIQMANDSTSEAVTLADGTYLDLNGKQVTGVTLAGTLYGLDSSTNGYEPAKGYITVNTDSTGTIAAAAQHPNSVDGEKVYAAYTNSGATTFNRVAFPVTRYYVEVINDDAKTVSIGFEGEFRGNAHAIAALDNLGFVINKKDYTTTKPSDLATTPTVRYTMQASKDGVYTVKGILLFDSVTTESTAQSVDIQKVLTDYGKNATDQEKAILDLFITTAT